MHWLIGCVVMAVGYGYILYGEAVEAHRGDRRDQYNRGWGEGYRDAEHEIGVARRRGASGASDVGDPKGREVDGAGKAVKS